MAQTIQRNDHMVMIRDTELLLKSKKLLSTIYEKIIYPKIIITLIQTPNTFHCWQANIISEASSYLNRSFQTGDSFILDFGTHGVGYLSL